MFDYYLKTADEAQMQEVLAAAGVLDDLGNLVSGASLDVIGVWYERTGGTDEEPVLSAVPGWHFNIRSDAEVVWPAPAVVLTPATPWRVWA